MAHVMSKFTTGSGYTHFVDIAWKVSFFRKKRFFDSLYSTSSTL